MRTRKEAAEFIASQMEWTGDHKPLRAKSHEKEKYTAFHYGKVELRALMDYIYEAAPHDSR